jgi:hypothetical protein
VHAQAGRQPAWRPRLLAEGRMGLAGPGGLERVGPSGWARYDRFCFFIFFEFIFNEKTIPEKSSNCFKAQKYSENSKKLRKKFPETHWDTNNPNKVFGAHKKILEPSNK